MWTIGLKSLFLGALSLILITGCQPTPQEQGEINTALEGQGCEIPPSFDGYTCKGRFVARSVEDMNSYLSDYGLKNGFVKHLKIDFEYAAETIQVTSPCSITVRDNASLTSNTGSSCLIAKGHVKAKGMNFQAPNGNTTFASYEGNVIIDDNSTINTRNLNLMGQHKAVIQNTATITAHDINMKSFGTEDDSRVHIRHSSNVTANNIYLEAKRKATLGRDSLYNVSGTVRIIGEGPDDDSDNPEFATIWKGTTVNANELIINSLSKTKVSGGITINANRIELNGPACHLGKTAIFNSPVKEGNCFSGDHPTAKLKVAKELRTGTAPHEVFFDASKSSDNDAIVSYEWKIGELETLTTTAPNLTYTFTTPGVYKVRLKVTDTSGLLDYRTRKITVEEAPIPDGGPVAYFKFMTEDGELTTYFFGKKGINEIASGTYEILGTGITANLNSFYTRTENIFDSLPRALYQVKLTLTDTAGLSSSFTHNVDLTTDEGAPFVKFDVVQSGVLQAFVNAVDSFDPYEFSEIEIDWGDGSDPDVDENFFFSHSYSAAGTYPVTVKLIGDSGKVTSLTKNVTVDSTDPGILSPVANFEVFEEFENDGTSHIRFHEQYSGSPNAPIISYLWDFGDGTTGTGEDIVHFYNPGVYDVSLTVTDFAGLTNTQVQRVIVTEGGLSFVSEMYCFSDNNSGDYFCDVLAADKLEGLSEIVMDWGDGTTETLSAENALFSEVSFEHVYATSGTFQAKSTTKTVRGETIVNEMTLSGSNGGGGGDNQAPVAIVNCVNLNSYTVQCDSAGSYDPDGTISDYYWEFGDGTGVTTGLSNNTIIHEYELPGTYTVGLSVVDNQEEVGFRTAEVTTTTVANKAPVAIINCEHSGKAINCEGNGSFDPDGDQLSSYAWDMGDGTILFGNEVEHNYLINSTYTVKLTVEDSRGLSDEATQELIIQSGPPIAGFDCNVNLKNITCTSNSTDPDSDIISYEWDMGDGESKVGELINHSYTIGSTYSISLKVTDIEGNEDSISKNILINTPPLPVVSISITGPQEVSLDATESNDSDLNDSIASYEWTFSDGKSASGALVKHIFQSGGEYDILLKTTDTHGATSEYETSITVEQNLAPLASFVTSTSEGPSPLVVSVEGSSSSDPEGRPLLFNWEFGDGETGTGASLSHTYQENGEYLLKLTVIDHLGLTSSLSKTILVGDKPTPVINVNRESGIVKLDEFQFDGSSSSDPNYNIVKYKWDFGDGVEIVGKQVVHRYQFPGEYKVTLKVTNEIGIEQMIKKDIIVSNDVITFLSLPSSEALENEMFTFLPNLYVDDNYLSDLTFSILDAPAGMTIDTLTGEISWLTPELSETTEFSFSIQAISLTKIVSLSIDLTVFPTVLAFALNNLEANQNYTILETGSLLDGMSIKPNSNLDRIEFYTFGNDENGDPTKFSIKTFGQMDLPLEITPNLLSGEVITTVAEESFHSSNTDINIPIPVVVGSFGFQPKIQYCPNASVSMPQFFSKIKSFPEVLFGYEKPDGVNSIWALQTDDSISNRDNLERAKLLEGFLSELSVQERNIIIYDKIQINSIRGKLNLKKYSPFYGDPGGLYFPGTPNFIFVDSGAFENDSEIDIKKFLAKIVVHEGSHRLQYKNYGCRKFMDETSILDKRRSWINEGIASSKGFQAYPEEELIERFNNDFDRMIDMVTAKNINEGLLGLDSIRYKKIERDTFLLFRGMNIGESFWTWMAMKESTSLGLYGLNFSSVELLSEYYEYKNSGASFLLDLKKFQQKSLMSSNFGGTSELFRSIRNLLSISPEEGLPITTIQSLSFLKASSLGSAGAIIKGTNIEEELIPGVLFRFQEKTSILKPKVFVSSCNKVNSNDFPGFKCASDESLNLIDKYPDDNYAWVPFGADIAGDDTGASVQIFNHDFNKKTDEIIPVIASTFMPSCLEASGIYRGTSYLQDESNFLKMEIDIKLDSFSKINGTYKPVGDFIIRQYKTNSETEVTSTETIEINTDNSSIFLAFSPTDLAEGYSIKNHGSGIYGRFISPSSEDGTQLLGPSFQVHFGETFSNGKYYTNCDKIVGAISGQVNYRGFSFTEFIK
ncbi:MAG: hypothetical protein CME70_20090 [Halobacteriovorax sp.]|nr:hypothetical protein [Halobacteriovorax sp.]|tara:strand:- start:85266 stop:91496 length:6231 start_codon:yes stop_codon:yes gene_type:complete